MPSRETHTASIAVPVVLLAVGTGLDFILDHILHFLALFGGTWAPDILEPARHYNHRKFFHSIQFLKFLFAVCAVSGLLGLVLDTNIWILSMFCIGYIVHLALDSTTQMGLPRR